MPIVHRRFSGVHTGRVVYPTAYAAAILADSPISYWRLDELSGTVAADVKGSNPLTYLVGYTLGAAGALVGDANTAVSFAGTGYTERADDDSLDIAGDSTLRSVEFWIKTTAINGTIFAKDSATFGLRIQLDGAGHVRIQAQGSSTLGTGSVLVNDGGWHHVVWSRPAYPTATALFVDGAADAGYSGFNDNFAGNAGVFRLARGVAVDNYLIGSLDEVAVYNAALTPAQVLSHYQAGSGGVYGATVRYDRPVAYWRCGELSGTVAADVKGSNPGAYNGSPTLGVAGAIVGDTDTGVAFNGTTQYMQVTDVSLAVGDVLSLEIWAKRSAVGGPEAMLFSKNSNAYALSFSSVTVDRVAFNRDNLAVIAESTTAITDTTTWHHIVSTKSGAAVRIYIDAVDVTGVVTNQTLVDNVNVLRIGVASSALSQFLSAAVDEPAIYNYVLTPAQVTAHFVAGGGVVAGQGVPFPFIGGGYYGMVA